MDDADRAQPLIEAEAAHAALARVDTHPRPQVRNALVGPICCECGDPIPAERLRVVPGACRCFECQELVEEWGGN
jgi:phage/conjugal plasmid C-4 type zinc finger TraR family protein